MFVTVIWYKLRFIDESLNSVNESFLLADADSNSTSLLPLLPAPYLPFLYEVNCEPRIIVPIPTSVKISSNRAWGMRPSMMCAARTP